MQAEEDEGGLGSVPLFDASPGTKGKGKSGNLKGIKPIKSSPTAKTSSTSYIFFIDRRGTTDSHFPSGSSHT
jgi:hypothetical protein